MSQLKFGQSAGSVNTLRDRVRLGRKGGIDPDAIARAEPAMQKLSIKFSAWLHEEITKLEGARATILAEGPSEENMEVLYLRSHDLKGLGTTYGFPLISRIAGLLCRLIEEKALRLKAPFVLIHALIQGIKASVRENITTEDHPVEQILVQELEVQIKALGA